MAFSARATAEQPVDQAGQPGHLAERSRRSRRRLGLIREQVELQPKGRQRRAELVRYVLDDRAVPVHERLHPPGHRVERVGEAAELGGQEAAVALADRSPSPSPRAAVSRTANGRAAHRDRPSPMRTAAARAAAAIRTRVSQNVRRTSSSRSVGRLRATMPTVARPLRTGTTTSTWSSATSVTSAAERSARPTRRAGTRTGGPALRMTRPDGDRMARPSPPRRAAARS